MLIYIDFVDSVHNNVTRRKKIMWLLILGSRKSDPHLPKNLPKPNEILLIKITQTNRFLAEIII